MKLAFSLLCENPARRTGLTSFFQLFVEASLRVAPEVRWVVFAGPGQTWDIDDTRVETVRRFPANDRLLARLLADHFFVGPEAHRRGAQALITVGFMPAKAPLPVAMHVLTLHHQNRGGGVVDALRSAYRRRTLRSGLRRAALVITNSAWAAGRLGPQSPLADRLLVSPEGLDHRQFNPIRAPGEGEELRRTLGLPRRYLLWVSNFYAYKQAGRLLAAYGRLAPSLRSEFPLVMAGGDWKGGLGHARSEAAARGLANDVRFAGWIDDRWLPALYRQAHAHILPSAEETFGKTLTEAMACGCPCLLNDIPVFREIAGEAASFVDFCDESAAAAALTALCGEGRLGERLRAEGLRRAADFSYEKLARERIDRIRAALGNAA